MGKKGSWFSALMRVLKPGRKLDPAEDKKDKGEKKGLGRRRDRNSNSFIPLFRKPSSIEKILSDVDREQQKTIVPPPRENQAAVERSENDAAIMIQKVYRGYLGRRSTRAHGGLMRLQEVLKCQNVKRQTTNALKYMQLLLRVQSQIRSRRIHMIDNQKDKDLESRSSARSETVDEAWNDSLLPKEEMDARSRRKTEAVARRERAAIYSYSNQLLRSLRSANLIAFRHGDLPRWWNWLEISTPPRANDSDQASSKPHTNRRRSFQSAMANSSRTKHQQQPSSRSPRMAMYCKSRLSVTDSTSDAPFKDDDSLTSCPPFSVPNYMTPTVSAMAKVRANNEESAKRRLSYPPTPATASRKWSRASPSPKLQSLNSPVSVDSTSSLPASLGRKPFNRFA